MASPEVFRSCVREQRKMILAFSTEIRNIYICWSISSKHYIYLPLMCYSIYYAWYFRLKIFPVITGWWRIADYICIWYNFITGAVSQHFSWFYVSQRMLKLTRLCRIPLASLFLLYFWYFKIYITIRETPPLSFISLIIDTTAVKISFHHAFDMLPLMHI